MEVPKTADAAHIGRSVVVKGELSGSEDLYVDGQVEGTIELHGNSLTVGPNGQVRANVNAKNLVVHGKLDGNVRVSERTELRKTAVVSGDIVSQKIAIEDGAFFKGKVDIQKELPKTATAAIKPAINAPVSAEKKPDMPAQTARPTPPAASSAAAATSSPANLGQPGKTPVTEEKKF